MPRLTSLSGTMLLCLATCLCAQAQRSPEMMVEDASGTELGTGATIDFGTVDFGAFVETPVFIKSVGTSALTFATSRSGPQVAEFTWPPLYNHGVLSPNSFVKVPIRFKPLGLGPSTATLRVTSDDPNEPETLVTLKGTVLWSEILLEQPAGTVVTTTGDSRSFGDVAAGGEALMTFTLRNTGAAYLRNISATLSGTNAADFSVAKPPTTPLAPGATTTLIVRLTPQATGLRSASLRLTSNASIPSPSTYVIPLSGNGMLSRISLAAPLYRAMHGDSQGLITLTRSPAQSSATVRLTTSEGPGMPGIPFIAAAVAGQDYQPRTGDGALVSFVAGEAQKTVPISLLSPAELAETNRRLTVTLSQPSLGAELGTQHTASLRILAADSSPPTLTLITPKSGAVTGPVPMTVRCVAGDARGVERVEVVLNDGSPALAIQGAATDSMEVPYTLPITPLEGPNMLVVTATDVFGNSTSVIQNFTFTKRQLLTLRTTDGDTGATSVQGGAVALIAVPASGALALVAEATEAVRTSLIIPGTVVKLVASPKAGQVFSRWISPNEPGLPLAKLGTEVTFTMPDAAVTVTAEFVPTPFATPAGSSASVQALLSRQYGQLRELVAIPFEQQGYLTGTLTSTGGFSGRLMMNSQSVPVVATLYANASAVFTVGSQKTDALSLPQQDKKLRLENNRNAEQPLRAVVVNANGSGIFSRAGRRTKKPSAGMLNSATRGYYTLHTLPPAFAPPQQPPASLHPRGHGYATMHLQNTGQITMTAVLSDDTRITMSTALVAGDLAPMYVPLPTPGGTTKIGLIVGELKFAPDPAEADVDGLLRWYRPAAVSPNVMVYPQGWPDGIDVTIAGGLYDASMNVQTALALPAPAPWAGNAALTITDGGLAAPLSVTNFSVNKNAVAKIPASDKTFTLTLDPAMGFFSGSFTPVWAAGDPSPTKPAFRGVILQKPAFRIGAGFFIGNALNTTTQESGAVVLEP